MSWLEIDANVWKILIPILLTLFCTGLAIWRSQAVLATKVDSILDSHKKLNDQTVGLFKRVGDLKNELYSHNHDCDSKFVHQQVCNVRHEKGI